MSASGRERARRLLLRAGSLALGADRSSAVGNWPPRQILLIRPDHLGDVLWLTPALRALRQQCPEASITVAIGPWSKPILDHSTDYDDLLLIAFPGFTRRPKGSPLAPYQLLQTTARDLRARQFDAVLILRDDHWWGALLAATAGIPRRFGFAHPDVAPFLTDPLSFPIIGHTARGNLQLVDALLAAIGRPGLPDLADEDAAAAIGHPLVYTPGDEAEQHAASLLAGLDGAGPIVAIHASAGVPVKLWDEGRLAAVADRLVTERGARIVLTGSPGDEVLTGAVAAAMASGAPRDLTGQTNIPQLVALYRRCDLVIGPDSGALHLAVAAGVPTLHLYGPADPVRFGPWGDPARQRVVRAGMHCDRCGDLSASRPRGAACMLAISVDDVLAVARDLLAQAVSR